MNETEERIMSIHEIKAWIQAYFAIPPRERPMTLGELLRRLGFRPNNDWRAADLRSGDQYWHELGVELQRRFSHALKRLPFPKPVKRYPSPEAREMCEIIRSLPRNKVQKALRLNGQTMRIIRRGEICNFRPERIAKMRAYLAEMEESA